MTEESKKAHLPLAPLAALAKEAGVERIGAQARETFRDAVEDYVKKLAIECNDVAKDGKRITVQETDIPVAVVSLYKKMN